MANFLAIRHVKPQKVLPKVLPFPKSVAAKALPTGENHGIANDTTAAPILEKSLLAASFEIFRVVGTGFIPAATPHFTTNNSSQLVV